jgi:glutamyl-tRNA synthetase
MYKKYADELVDLGGAHYCFCSEEDIQKQRDLAAEHGEAFKFMDPCHAISKEDARARIANGEKYVVRQTIPSYGTTSFDDEVYGHIEVENSILDENVLLKSDGYPTYNFANVIDDHHMHITHVVRGNEYLSSTPKYNLIYNAYGWQIPTYVHVPPVMKDEQHKLSKRNGDASFQDLLAKGYLAEAILNYIALLGWSPEDEQEIFTLRELEERFTAERINKSPAIFDINKLTWMNGMYIRNLSVEEFNEKAMPYYTQAIKRDIDHMYLSKTIQARVETLVDILEAVDFLDAAHAFDASLYQNKKMKTTPENSLEALRWVLEKVEACEEYTEEVLHDVFMNLAVEKEVKNGRVMYPARVALSNKARTPGGAVEIAVLLGKEETVARLKQAIADLEAALA